MELLLAFLAWAIIWLLHLQREKCLREGRPFFRLSTTKQRPSRMAVVQSAQKQYRQRLKESPQAPRYKSRPSPVTQPADVRPTNRETINRKLFDQLNSLTHDQRTTRRLIENEREKNPDRTLDWCAERAIWNIERDRR